MRSLTPVERVVRTVKQVVIAAGAVVPVVLGTLDAGGVHVHSSAVIVAVTASAVAGVSAAWNAVEAQRSEPPAPRPVVAPPAPTVKGGPTT